MSFGKTINLGNSIIGVSILAMPYCFVRSGLLLSILLIILSGFLTRLSCHLLLKSAFLSKRRSFELMVQDVLGSAGRFLVEIGLTGFLLGSCVAYFIMIGDLAPKILAEFFDLTYDNNLRIVTVALLSLFVALPLSLLKKVDSLTSLSLLSMGLYSCLVLKLMFETTDKLSLDPMNAEKFSQISYWDMSGLLTTFPIFSMAMSCQTTLFEIFDSSVVNSDLDIVRRENGIIKKAIYLCSFVYITVGLLGYMAFHNQTICGNILLSFPPSLTTTLSKLGFIVSLLLSFPLCLFPCRTSLHSLTFAKIRSRKHQRHSSTWPPASTFVGIGPSDVNCINPYTDKTNAHCDNVPSNNGDRCNGKSSETGNDETKVDKASTLNYTLNKTNEIFMNYPRLNSILTKNTPYAYSKLLEYDEDSYETNLNLSDHHETKDRMEVCSQSNGPQSMSKSYMSDFHFKFLTVILIIATVVLSLLFPNIEFILGIIGSTAGTTVCFVLPAYTFIRLGACSRTELYLAKMLLSIGLAMLVFCTYATVHNANLSVPLPASSIVDKSINE